MNRDFPEFGYIIARALIQGQRMAKCHNCGTETELYSADLPTCVACVQAEEEEFGLRNTAKKDQQSESTPKRLQVPPNQMYDRIPRPANLGVYRPQMVGQAAGCAVLWLELTLRIYSHLGRDLVAGANTEYCFALLLRPRMTRTFGVLPFMAET